MAANENVLHLNLHPRNRYNTGELRCLEGYGASVSPGMGLENEILHSFIVRNRGNVVEIGEPQQYEAEHNEPEQNDAQPEVAASELPEPKLTIVRSMPSELRSGAPAPEIACRFRRMKTATFTNLVARALNE